MKLTSCCVCLNHQNNQSGTECPQSLSIMSEISDEWLVQTISRKIRIFSAANIRLEC